MSDSSVSMTDLMNGLGQSGTPRFIQHNLVSDGAVPAEKTDPNLINPWGVSFSSGSPFSPGSPFWISENGQGLASVDSLAPNGNAIKLNVHDPVTIPSPTVAGTSAPTGQVFTRRCLTRRLGSCSVMANRRPSYSPPRMERLLAGIRASVIPPNLRWIIPPIPLKGTR